MKKSLSFRSFKKSTIIALTLIFIFSQNSFAVSDGPVVMIYSDQPQGVMATDYPNNSNYINVYSAWGRCKDFSDPKCLYLVKNQRDSFKINQVFPPCLTADELSICIEKVEVIKPGGKIQSLKLDRTLTGYTWPADPLRGILASSTPSLWIDPSVNVNKGYQVALTSNLTVFSGRELDSISKTLVEGFDVEVIPYKTMKGDFKPNPAISENFASLEYPDYPSWHGMKSFPCLWEEIGKCGVRIDEIENRFRLTLHLPSESAQWISGQVKDPVVNISDNSLGELNDRSIARVTLEANPVSTAIGLYELGPVGAKGTFFFWEKFGGLSGPWGQASTTGQATGIGVIQWFSRFAESESSVKVKDNKHYSVWKMSGLPKGRDGQGCRYKGDSDLKAVVSSNSYMYTEIPTFDGNSFKYKIAALHHTPEGEVFKGNFQLTMNSEYARCYFGLSNAPIKASISVTSTDGTVQSISTEVVNEKNGFINVESSNFTFSQPTVTIKIIGEPLSKSTTTQATKIEANKVTSAKKTITCIKGKTIKKVTGLAPKCPTGYKKK